MCLECDFEKKALCRLKFHIMCGPKSESRLLQGPLEAAIKKLIAECATANEWKLDEVAIHDNLAHIIIELPQTISLDKAISTLKAATSSGLKAAFPTYEEFTNNGTFWAEGYIAQTLDGFTSEQEFMDFLSGEH